MTAASTGEQLAAGLLLVPDHVHDRVDEGQVGERLREVAQVPAGPRVDLLRVKQQRAGVGQHLLAEVPGPPVLTDLGQGETSQKVQIVKVPSSPGSPSSVSATR